MEHFWEAGVRLNENVFSLIPQQYITVFLEILKYLYSTKS